MSHARLGPSNARWPKCPGSVRMEEGYEDVAGAAAIDGTGSHLLLEMCLDNNVHAEQYDMQLIGANHPDNPGGWLVAPDRIERVQMCLDYVTRRVAELKEAHLGCTVTVESEQKSDPGGMFGRDDWWGTVDITIICRDSHMGTVLFIEVIDYKDGRGWVNAENNTQLISYLAGKMRPFVASGPDLVRPFKANEVRGCRMTIVQPKTNPVVRYDDDTTPFGVINHAEKLSIAAHATDDPDAPLVTGKHCQWCKANPKRGGHCTAESDKSLATVETMSTDIIATDNKSLFEYIGSAISDPASLTVDQLADLADARDGIMAVFDKVNAEIKLRIDQGDHVPGYEMQPGRNSRVWNEDEETIVKKLKGRRLKQADIYPAKLISVAQVMKLDKLTDEQKAKIEKELVTNKSGKMSLQKVSRDKPHQAPFKEVPTLDVVQSSTDELPSAQMMFGDVTEQPSKPVSFL